MLDTNIVSDLIGHPAGKVAQYVAKIGDLGLVVSIVTAGELQYGAAKRGSARLQQRVEAVLGRLPVIALDVPADVKYVDIRVALGAAGTPIGSKDLLIAAHAIAMGIPLVTANIDQFTGICNLVVENWRE